ncbi:MAG: Flp pilus assembly complex ATPase component TadA [Planctomycetes bacterium]|jgi:type IV pilus assembly protein PilB|nr:Flp pilus assembly complex ATPase component TadA [Planctomycetota bacterium]HON44921.1 ATPase, T2SS/T4P/T4SS family [Planctomycetota bacterium]HRU51237.1 ATPase, T2SS/T4P/T4SS family [Planctomycetota bacterium]
MAKQRKRLGSILKALGIIDESQLNDALQYQQENGCKLGESLIALQYATQVQITQALARQFAIPYVDLSKGEIPQDVIDTVPRSVVEEHSIIPVKKTNRSLIVAMIDPLDLLTLDNMKFILGCEVECALTTPDSMSGAIAKYYGVEKNALDDIYSAITETDIYSGDDSIEEVTTEDDDMAEDDDAPVIRLVTLIISEALKNRASDIHIEPLANKLRVRYRIDGICQEVDSPPKRLQGSILSRLKIMSEMNIAERRIPQDGRIKVTLQGRDIDLRVSALPCYHGESMVMRILDKEKALVSLDELGFYEIDYDRFQRIIKKPNGIFLVTGPTGSGKTTTLYAALSELNRPDVKIITAEHPVEYNIAGINQCQVRHEIGLNFASILRAMLRQAPNVVLVGEIRDTETAEIAIQAALTGHLVFSTLHTNDAPSAITRLIDMGVKPFLVSSAVQAILAQRLIRRLCPKCKQLITPTEAELASIGLTKELVRTSKLYGPKGCDECKGGGYRGRLGIYELLEMSPPIRELTFHQAPTMKLREEAQRSGGMTTLQEDGVRKILSGLSSIPEVLRVTHAK